ncbi:protein of unknown function [Actinomadura meyerae]|uniref:DUF4132 domain-containing protein n=1 Tax=Actinomadura meyerae TaxID=240840 RepID=A0A239ER59_9ACTN|nr:DUF4132 domain-containing protein [Actinomadura meyerae]SNS46911.1 protein of unknown function [Actinomadura meyerae]
MEDQPPGEDVLTLPEPWRRAVHARRGGTPGPKIKTDPAAPAAVRDLVERTGGAVEALRAGGAGDPALAEAARRHLDGAPDPVGAAAVAAVTVLGAGGANARDAIHRAYVDAWLAEHGIAFTACALVELSRTEAVRQGGGPWKGTWVGAARVQHEATVAVPADEARRVRGLLAVASDADYAAAVDRLAAHRTGFGARWLVSYLVPTRQDWVDECCAAPVPPRTGLDLILLALSALGSADQLAAPLLMRGLPLYRTNRALVATLVDGIGSDVLPLLLRAVDGGSMPSDDRRTVMETIAFLPTDEAFWALLDRLGLKHARAALGEAARRFPVRALRLLAAAGADELLAGHVAAHPEVVAAALPGLPDDVAAAVERVAVASERVADAAPDEVPAVLAAPPWRAPRRPVLKGLTPPAPRLAWHEGERREWLGTELDKHVGKPGDDVDWEAAAEGYRSGEHKLAALQLMCYGPEEVVRPLLPGYEGLVRRFAHVWMRPLVARYELDALPVALRTARPHLETCGDPLLPYLDAEVALLMADGLVKRGNRLEPARRWFDRHGLAAVPLLVPAALGTKAKDRRGAETALRYLHAAHGLPGVADAARAAHGDDAGAAIGELLSLPPTHTGLAQPVKTGTWIDPALLPQVLLRKRDRALPLDAVNALIELLTLDSPHEMDDLAEACEPGSLAEFGWGLFRQWLDAGKPAKDGWALRQLGRTGDDGTVRRLTPVIRAWPGEGGHRNAVTGLGVLAEIGTDVALMHLHGIAQKVKFKGLQVEAQARIREVADRLGLTTEELGDRLVPGFGLDADGGMVLDYGPRRFRVGFDEQLKPFVTDEDGKRRKALPKPGAKDDPELAPAAYTAFAGLKKDVRTAAADQIRRLERAMVTQRRWAPDDFGEFIVRHPLVRHIARRLLWVAEHDGAEKEGAGNGGAANAPLETAFRIAEDGTFADVDDDVFDLPAAARVRLMHPALPGTDVKAWAEVFADYEILQPFPQLGRPVHVLAEDDRDSGRLARFEGLKVPFGKVLGLVKLGWERGEPQDAGGERWISRRVAADRYVVIDLDPGISVGAVDAAGDHQFLDYVWLATEPGDFWPSRGTPHTFGELDAVTASEVLADLTTLAEAAQA